MRLHGFRLQVDCNTGYFSFYINVDVDTEIDATRTYICNLKTSGTAGKRGLRVLILTMVYR